MKKIITSLSSALLILFASLSLTTVAKSADLATVVKDNDANKISKALDRDVIIFFIVYPSIYMSLFL